MKSRLERKKEFIHQLSEFLVGNQAVKSIGLESGNKFAEEWAALRSCTPLRGYPTVEEGEKVLEEFLL